jgi:hypothetical protein
VYLGFINWFSPIDESRDAQEATCNRCHKKFTQFIAINTVCCCCHKTARSQQMHRLHTPLCCHFAQKLKMVLKKFLANFFLISGGLLSSVSLTSAVGAAVISSVSMSLFTVVRSPYNTNPMCAVNFQPFLTLVGVSIELCAGNCRHWSCDGFNYRDDGSVCEIYASNALVFGVQANCRYFTVRITSIASTSSIPLKRANMQ